MALLPIAPLSGLHLAADHGWPPPLAYLTAAVMFLLPELASVAALRGEWTLYRLMRLLDTTTPQEHPGNLNHATTWLGMRLRAERGQRWACPPDT